ncbi:MAG: DUF2892 domain-containing protein [Candidatus Aminicenantes bacterium]|nr:DUF2892 domain-containing protein [Candidatus Aminicenantes bacterium]
MKTAANCQVNRTVKWIRVILSLAILGAGIYLKSWLGLLGIITLVSAFTGSCPLCLHFNGPEGPGRGLLDDGGIGRNDRNGE